MAFFPGGGLWVRRGLPGLFGAVSLEFKGTLGEAWAHDLTAAFQDRTGSIHKVFL